MPTLFLISKVIDFAIFHDIHNTNKNGEIDKRLLLVHALADPRSNYCEKTINLGSR